MQTLQVDVGHSRYPITIGSGLLSNRDLIEAQIPRDDLMIVTNTTVAPLYLAKLRESLGDRELPNVFSPTASSTRPCKPRVGCSMRW